MIYANSDMGNVQKVLIFVPESPNIMMTTRAYLNGERERCSNCVVLAFWCVSHYVSNLVKHLCTHGTLELTLRATIKRTQLFRNANNASDLLDNVKKSTEDPQVFVGMAWSCCLSRSCRIRSPSGEFSRLN